MVWYLPRWQDLPKLEEGMETMEVSRNEILHFIYFVRGRNEEDMREREKEVCSDVGKFYF